MSAAGLAAQLAEAAQAAEWPESTPRSSRVAFVCPDGFVMCVKPWAADAWGAMSEVCSSKPAHHDGPCGPWMPEIGEWQTPAPRDAGGYVVNLDEFDYGLFNNRTCTPRPDRIAPYDFGGAV